MTWPPDLTHFDSQIVAAIAGIFLLIAGRRLFWLVLAVAGFAAGTILASRLPLELDQGWSIAVAILCGLGGLLVVKLARRLAVPLLGILGGGLGALYLVQSTAFAPETAPWLAFGVGALFGLFLSTLLVEAALIVFSSLIGASTLLTPFDLQGPTAGLAFLALTLIGVAIQSRGWKK
ncbi:MAG: DUF4203 domain-containing protein [Deltaproteobacteria bacterium]|nr:DUF4203 domain-containing protein [Deltaproteobacteria bacterium]